MATATTAAVRVGVRVRRRRGGRRRRAAAAADASATV